MRIGDGDLGMRRLHDGGGRAAVSMTATSGFRPVGSVRRAMRTGCGPSRSSGRRSPGCAPPRRCAARASTAASSRSAPSRTCPYDRPPLSKELLARRLPSPTDIVLRKQGVDDLDLDWRLGARGDRARRRRRATVELHDGERVAFDGLVIATGSTPRRLPNQPDLAGVFTLRTLDDALALRAPLDARAEGRRDRRGLHRRRGRGDVPGARARRDRARGAAAADGARARARARRGDRRRCTATTASTCAPACRSTAIEGDGAGRAACGSATARVVDADVVVVGVGVVPETELARRLGAHARQRRRVRRDVPRRARHRRRGRRRALAEPAVRRRS